MGKKKNIAVIGAGIGGLSAAARLSAKGYNVTVFEQSSTPGGKANQLIFNGFRFDTGPSLLTMPFVIDELFADCGKKTEDYIKIKPLEILCKYFYPDNTTITAYNDTEKFAAEISGKTTDSKGSVLDYLKYSEKIYERTNEMFLHRSLSELKTFFNKKAFNTLLHIKDIDPFRTMHEANKSFFNDPKTIQLFDRYATYNGSDPYKAPATLNIIQHVEYNLGGYYAKEGIYSVVNGLYKLNLELGTRFSFNSEVKKIVTQENKVSALKVKSAAGDVKVLPFDIIISNADVYNTGKYLLDKPDSENKYSKHEPSSSALVFYFGVKGIHPQLEAHNILFSDDYSEEFKDIFDKKSIPQSPTIYIYISSKLIHEDAPEGNENWFVMINMPHYQGNEKPDTEMIKSRLLTRIRIATGIDLSDKIIEEKLLTPEMIEHNTGSHGGSLYGISSNSKQAAFLRQQNKSRELKGLYYCGGSAHPGGGIPLVILSGEITASMIMKHEGGNV